jgi:hypothetical protein
VPRKLSSELFDKVYTASHIDAVRTHVKQYRDMGIAVIPRNFMTKGNGIEWKQYQDRAPTDEEVNQWFYSSETMQNVAAVLGPVSGNLLDIDVDGDTGCARASRALSDLGYCNNHLRGCLINTFMTRSGSHHGFHFLLRVDKRLFDDDENDDAPFHRYLFSRAKEDLWTGNGEHQGISLLWKGSLAILALSVHESGKMQFYSWNHKAPQTIMTAKELKELFSIFSDGEKETLWDRKKRDFAKKCQREERNNSPDTIPLTGFGELGGPTAAGMRTQIEDKDKEFMLKLLMKNNRYRKGNRHKITMGVAGYLRWHSYTKEAALKFINFVCDFFHDEERESRRRAVEDTYSKPTEEVAWRTWLDGID